MPEPRRLATPGPIALSVRNAVGTVEITAAEVDTTVVTVTPLSDSSEARELADRTTVELSPDRRRLAVHVPERHRVFSAGRSAVAVAVTVPAGSTAITHTASASTTCLGTLRELKAHTASGDIHAAHVADRLHVHGASGRVEIGTAGTVDVHTASGAIAVNRVTGDARLHTGSGRISVGVAEASVRVRSGSADAVIGSVQTGAIELVTGSGNLRVGVAAGAVARLDLVSAGLVRSELAIDDDRPAGGAALTIRARSGSGNIVITKATKVRPEPAV